MKGIIFQILLDSVSVDINNNVLEGIINDLKSIELYFVDL